MTLLEKIMKHLQSNVTDLSVGVSVIEKFPSVYMHYPLNRTTLAVSFRAIELTALGSAPAGIRELEIDVFTARDHGLYTHQAIVDKTVDALCSLSGPSVPSAKISEPKYDRTSSALHTEIVCPLAFGN